MSTKGAENKSASVHSIKISPIADRIVVRQDAAKEMEGSIIVPDGAKEKPCRGVVIAVGPGELDRNGQRKPMQVKVGDTIIYGKFNGTEVSVGDPVEELIILKEVDVLAIL